MNLPQVVLDYSASERLATSCPSVVIDGFRVPSIQRVNVDTPFDGLAIVTITFVAKVSHRGAA